VSFLVVVAGPFFKQVRPFTFLFWRGGDCIHLTLGVYCTKSTYFGAGESYSGPYLLTRIQKRVLDQLCHILTSANGLVKAAR
jgi:hypothetical protein